jgi:GH35 family endo-1,4-beta-xylanase
MKLSDFHFVDSALTSTVLAVAGLTTFAHAEDKYVKAFFEKEDSFVQDVILPNVEKHRKGDFTLTVANGGEPLADSQISLELVRHAFHFGAAPPRQLFDDPKIRDAYFDIWEFGVVENTFKWGQMERVQGKTDYGKTDALVGFFEERDLPLELHFLTGYHPEWLNEKSDEEKAKLQQEHALRTIERYRDKTEYIQVYNEIWHAPIDRAAVFFDPKEFFQELTNRYPDTKFGVSDCWQFNEPLPAPEEVKRRFPGIDFLSIHAHKPRRLWASPQQIYTTFDPWIDCGIHLHITEFGILPGEIEGSVRTGTWDEELAAEYFVSMVMTVFSHPAVRAMNFWGNGPDEKLSFPVTRMMRPDGTFTPAYFAMKDLIKRKLKTAAALSTAADGSASFRGFYGTYRVTWISADGSSRIGFARFSPSETSASVGLELD